MLNFFKPCRPIMNIDIFVNVVSFLLCLFLQLFFCFCCCSVLFCLKKKHVFKFMTTFFSYTGKSCSSNHDTVNNLYTFSSLQIAVVAVMCKPHRCPHISMTGNICVYCPGGPDSDFEYSTQSYTGYEVITHIMRKYCFIKEIAGLDLELWGSQPLWFLAPLKKKGGAGNVLVKTYSFTWLVIRASILFFWEGVFPKLVFTFKFKYLKQLSGAPSTPVYLLSEHIK